MFNYSISIEGNKVRATLCTGCGKTIRRGYAYIKGEGGAKDVAQAVSYATYRLYHDWKEIDVNSEMQVDIDEDELMKAIKTHEEELANGKQRSLY